MSARTLIVLGLLSGLCHTTVAAQTYPGKPVRVLTGGAGGGNDIAARLIAEALTALWPAWKSSAARPGNWRRW